MKKNKSKHLTLHIDNTRHCITGNHPVHSAL